MIFPLPEPSLLAKYDRPAPRYTSYPTTPHFKSPFLAGYVEGWLSMLPRDSLSLYVHLPYCKQLCLYCGCNMKVTHKPIVIATYMRGLLREIEHAAGLIPHRPRVSTLHLGGGTPTYCPPELLISLFETLRRHFDLEPGAEISLEADPRSLDADVIAVLSALGLNRVSLGIQDTNPQVQAIIGRHQPHALNIAAVERLRAAGIDAINLDMVYGLPGQTESSVTTTMADVLALAPDRFALYCYAHVPWIKKHQVVLEKHHLPTSSERIRQFHVASQALEMAGYLPIGIDHFARQNDALAVAVREKRLHRSFMGYTTDQATIQLGFGASAISRFPQGYAQNAPDISGYLAQANRGACPVAKGLHLTGRDRVTARMIEDLLCTFRCDTRAVAQDLASGISPLSPENAARLAGPIADGLATFEDGILAITPKGIPFARAIAACLDDYLEAGAVRYSHAV